MSRKNDYYVYVYSDPDTRQPFYVGKGRGGRVRAHLDFEVPEKEKQEVIDRLHKQGREPIIEIMQWGLSEEAAFAAEAALIQLIGLNQLTNAQSGRGTYKLHADFIEYIRDKKPLRLSPRKGEEMLILSANGYYRHGMSRFELYDAVRGNLHVSKERVENCRLVLVLLNGYVIDVYVNPECVEAGRQVRSFKTKDETSGFDIVAGFANEILRNRFVGRELATTFVFNRFTYEKIRLPRGRF
jgi:hypothetical protein